jgi:hypothetical protein
MRPSPEMGFTFHAPVMNPIRHHSSLQKAFIAAPRVNAVIVF